MYHSHHSKAMATHSSTLAWKIPWMEEPGRLQSVGSLRVGHDDRFHFHFSLSCTGEGNGNPLQCSCLENPRDRGAWWAAVQGVAESNTTEVSQQQQQQQNEQAKGKNVQYVNIKNYISDKITNSALETHYKRLHMTVFGQIKGYIWIFVI